MNVFTYEMSPLGISLLVFGILGLIFSRFKNKKSTNTVSANNASVAAGRDINAPISITNTNKNIDLQKSSLTAWNIWNVVCGIATLIGLGLTIVPFLK